VPCEELPDTRAVGDGIFRQVDDFYLLGSGFDLSVCGYTTKHSVLLKLRDVAFLQIYRRCSPECFISNEITFNHRVRNGSKLDGPLVDQLSLFDGCGHTTLKILWKYYRALHLVGKKNSPGLAVAKVDAAIAASTNSSAATDDNHDADDDAHDAFVAIVAEELPATMLSSLCW
jgi:hypothetical protein